MCYVHKMNSMAKKNCMDFCVSDGLLGSRGSCLSVVFANFGKNLNWHVLSCCWLFLVRKVIKKSCFYMF